MLLLERQNKEGGLKAEKPGEEEKTAKNEGSTDTGATDKGPKADMEKFKIPSEIKDKDLQEAFRIA